MKKRSIFPFKYIDRFRRLERETRQTNSGYGGKVLRSFGLNRNPVRYSVDRQENLERLVHHHRMKDSSGWARSELTIIATL